MNQYATLTYIKDIALKLHDPKMFGGASLMVGAGFSKNAEGVGNRLSPPDWSELAAAMYEELYPKPDEGEKLRIGKKKRLLKHRVKIRFVLRKNILPFMTRIG